MRTCVGCRLRHPTHRLVRLVANPEGGIDVSRTATGRGAWLCAGSPECLEEAIRRRALVRALRRSVDTEAIDSLRVQLADRARMNELTDDEDC